MLLQLHRMHGGTSIVSGYELSYDAAGNLTNMDLFGDLNCDGQISVGEIAAFNLALADPSGYQQQYPGCLALIGDFNGDGETTVSDISHFTAAITAGGFSREFEYDEERCSRCLLVARAAVSRE